MNYLRGIFIGLAMVNCVNGFAPAFREAVVREIVTDILRGNISSVYRVDIDTRAQLKETLESSIKSLENQLLSGTQISLLKTACCASVGGLLTALAGYIYGTIEFSPALSGYLLRWSDNKIHDSWIKNGFPAEVNQEQVLGETNYNNALLKEYKTKMIRGIATFAATLGVYAASVFTVSYAAKILQNNEERKVMINNLQAALDELNQDNQ